MRFLVYCGITLKKGSRLSSAPKFLFSRFLLICSFFLLGNDQTIATVLTGVDHAGFVGLVIQESKKASAEFGGPENAGEVLNYIYTSAQELDGQDMEIVSQWLEEHGFAE